MGIILAFLFTAPATVIREEKNAPLSEMAATGYSLLLSTLCALVSAWLAINFHFENGTLEIINVISYPYGYIFTFLRSMHILKKK